MLQGCYMGVSVNLSSTFSVIFWDISSDKEVLSKYFLGTFPVLSYSFHDTLPYFNGNFLLLPSIFNLTFCTFLVTFLYFHGIFL